MSLIDTIIRADVRALAVYHVPDATGLLKLDAMENPYLLPPTMRHELGRRLAEVALNRYPVPSYISLKAKICAQLGVAAGFDIVLGNGSDELIAMLSIACATPGAKVLAPTPAFVMYALSAKLSGLEFVGVALRPDFSLDLPAMLAAIALHRPAITYLAYPNNPTGALFDAEAMVAIIEAVGEQGIVVVDEAYQPFAQASFMSRLKQYHNLIVMRTVSKLGLAGIRLGYMAGDAALLREFEKVRPPYNINVLTQCAAEYVLEHTAVLDQQAALLRAERARVSLSLAALPGLKVFKSDANFILVRVENVETASRSADDVFANLLARKILVKNVSKMHPLLDNCLRITISTPDENARLLQALTVALTN
ncbi:MAG: histidinol-phosphate transaminase [Pseudomonadota bacterium]